MRTELLFTSAEYGSVEKCSIGLINDHYEINSTITGMYDQRKFKLGYTMQVDQRWRTRMVAIDFRAGGNSNRIILQSDGEGNWVHDSIDTLPFRNCFDVDLSLTPITNSLPINRLKFEVDQTADISVLYFDLLQFQIYPVTQRYKRLSKHSYQFETVPKDFEATIEVDDEGFVVDYPGLFKRSRKTLAL